MNENKRQKLTKDLQTIQFLLEFLLNAKENNINMYIDEKRVLTEINQKAEFVERIMNEKEEL